MPWLPLYATSGDLDAILDWLDEEPSLAFIEANGSGRWIARQRRKTVCERYCIWHTPSGSLPLLQPGTAPDKVVEDPWQGWLEDRQGADPTVPYFGAGHPGIIWLNARPTALDSPDMIGMSSFEWIGNRYSFIGQAAPASTAKWWQRLRRKIKKHAIAIPRSGPLTGDDPEIWTMPLALTLIEKGAKRSINPL